MGEKSNELVARAKEASLNAYCPYSRFPVGAAVLSASGEVYTGCNIENASFGLTICAERAAIFGMVADGEREIELLVVFTPTAEPTAPCGACRQVINEFGPRARVVCACDGPKRIDMPLPELLPGAFGPDNLD